MTRPAGTRARALAHARRMGAEAAAFFEEFGIPQPNPFRRQPAGELRDQLVSAWADGYAGAIGAGSSR